MHLQILVQSPDLQIHAESVTGDQTLSDLKLSLFPESQHLLLSSFYFTLHGHPLPEDTPLSSTGISPLSTLVLRSRLRGGGGDGGATGAESRDCYLNMYAEKKPDKVDPNEQRLSKWLNCALSNEPLREPCVIDKLGNIFNKEALVEALLGKKLPKEFGHIKGLKDMITVRLLRFQYKFFALRKCGHVLSAKALKEIKSSSCLVCHEDFAEADKIVINGSEEELSGTKHVMAVEKASAKVERNGKVANGDVGHKGVNGAAAAKRFKAADMAPANATKDVYASIFTSSKKSDFKETFTCRSLPLGRN
ncbi:Ubiquitin-like domain superfamily [Sesbania bispinosa]|nr:Ubiquitin-like domain superfamily [Sesbania bispinosa]